MKLAMFFAVAVYGAFFVGIAVGYTCRMLHELRACLMVWLDGRGGAA